MIDPSMREATGSVPASQTMIVQRMKSGTMSYLISSCTMVAALGNISTVDLWPDAPDRVGRMSRMTRTGPGLPRALPDTQGSIKHGNDHLSPTSTTAVPEQVVVVTSQRTEEQGRWRQNRGGLCSAGTPKMRLHLA